MLPLAPPVVLFGYHSSAFTQKVRMVLKLKQIPYTWVKVPSMMPRPLLTSLFNLTYRKIPVVAIGRDVYCDTSLIIEALDQHPSFQAPTRHPSIYPAAQDCRNNRGLIRLFSSCYTDRPWFRVICGLMPSAVWRSAFGRDRAGLIGHPLDANKLEAKVPSHLAQLELHLSILEPQVSDVTEECPWLFSTRMPSLADVSLFFMLSWGRDVSRGQLVEDLTMGECPDLQLEGMENVFNERKFPGMWAWFHRVRMYFEQLPEVEERVVERRDEEGVEEVLQKLKSWKVEGGETIPMIPTSGPWDEALDARTGLEIGARVTVTPDDTGMFDPVVGDLVSASREEVVMRPVELEGKQARLDGARVHFPRLGFVVKPLGVDRMAKL